MIDATTCATCGGRLWRHDESGVTCDYCGVPMSTEQARALGITLDGAPLEITPPPFDERYPGAVSFPIPDGTYPPMFYNPDDT